MFHLPHDPVSERIWWGKHFQSVSWGSDKWSKPLHQKNWCFRLIYICLSYTCLKYTDDGVPAWDPLPPWLRSRPPTCQRFLSQPPLWPIFSPSLCQSKCQQLCGNPASATVRALEQREPKPTCWWTLSLAGYLAGWLTIRVHLTLLLSSLFRSSKVTPSIREGQGSCLPLLPPQNCSLRQWMLWEPHLVCLGSVTAVTPAASWALTVCPPWGLYMKRSNELLQECHVVALLILIILFKKPRLRHTELCSLSPLAKGRIKARSVWLEAWPSHCTLLLQGLTANICWMLPCAESWEDTGSRDAASALLKLLSYWAPTFWGLPRSDWKGFDILWSFKKNHCL